MTFFVSCGSSKINILFFYRLNEMLDGIEDEENELPDQIDVVIHPPGEGEDSDEEDGDEDQPQFQNLPRSLLNAIVEAPDDEEDEEENHRTPKRKKKMARWTDPFENLIEIPEAEKQKAVGFDGCTEPVDFFLQFFSDEVLNFIVNQTNDYALINLSTEELLVVIGVLLASGIVRQTRRRDFWRNQVITNSISRNRFEEIFPKLHFVPLTARTQNDKFKKLRALIKLLNDEFLQHAPDTNFFSVDESMVPYFGRHGCKQFIRGKPIRFGFKMWVLATAKGYCVQLQPYPGIAERKEDDYDFVSSGNVVFYFAKILRGHFTEKPLSITLDNYFTSLSLLKSMKDDLNVSGTGTIRRNKVLCYPFDNTSMQNRGEMMSKYSPDFKTNLVVWRDNKDVLVASTMCGATPISSTTRFCRKVSV